ncbi:hypothetical protein TNCV_500741 [Trichonephila clavipes]|nr:hypothetical protein TNCV_500741 [Trichonephila clavipes]
MDLINFNHGQHLSWHSTLKTATPRQQQNAWGNVLLQSISGPVINSSPDLMEDNRVKKEWTSHAKSDWISNSFSRLRRKLRIIPRI